MIETKALRGLGTALITPFLEDMSIDFGSLEQLLERQIAGGADYIVVLGTTGEAATMKPSEKRQVRKFVKDKVAGRLPLVLGMGGKCTGSVCEALRQEDLSGYDAILSVCPYYNKPNQEGLYRHFTAIAESSPLPVILYNVPGRTGVNMLPETVIRIHDNMPDKIIGIKEASGNMEQILQLIALRDQNFKRQNLLVISGDDGIAYPLMQAGANGLISVASNAYPEDFREIVHNTYGKAAQLQEKYQRLIYLLFKEGNPAGIKTVLSKQGLIKNVLRLPLVENSTAVKAQIASIMEAI
ncbi:MAG: 4-hydroxy-tetrahydrodipicolinate synthase [Paludibacteraceae bacterium]|nr:4-hydroxy-tetrahydrodipicolinate synthase [Paludibacteraceae bacterium]